MIPPLHIDNLNKFNKRGGEIEKKVVELERKTQPPSTNELANKITKKISRDVFFSTLN